MLALLRREELELPLEGAAREEADEEGVRVERGVVVGVGVGVAATMEGAAAGVDELAAIGGSGGLESAKISKEEHRNVTVSES